MIARVEQESLWRCPRCRGPLHVLAAALACPACAVEYACFESIPDLRLPEESWIDHEQDRADARRLMIDAAGCTAEQMARLVYGRQAGADEAWVELRTRQLVEGPGRMGRELEGWLAPAAAQGFLDLGCGYGQLLAAAADRGIEGAGIDVRLVWLLVAKRLIESRGGVARLAAATAGSLPLAGGSIPAVVSLDVIEHVGDARRYLREIDRVVAPGGAIALATPNRFSLTAEPHVSVWGVGLVPRRWQKAFVRWRSGKPYEFVRMLSVRETRRLLRQETRFDARAVVPGVPSEEIARFPARRAAVARAYNSLAGRRRLAPLLLLVGPFFRVVGRAP